MWSQSLDLRFGLTMAVEKPGDNRPTAELSRASNEAAQLGETAPTEASMSWVSDCCGCFTSIAPHKGIGDCSTTFAGWYHGVQEIDFDK
ncbi:hypothetical protein GCM10022223_25720 [Kineosporia mesophila]|uniref:Uncharacterized protein n=1 Tax=Kineosporia mesophila TaxID=566012 RepID=A0ABP6ZJU9_9ACTN